MFSSESKQGSFEKWLILGLREEIQDEPRVFCSIGTTVEPTKRIPNSQSRNNLSNKIHNAVLNYNPKYKKEIFMSSD